MTNREKAIQQIETHFLTGEESDAIISAFTAVFDEIDTLRPAPPSPPNEWLEKFPIGCKVVVRPAEELTMRDGRQECACKIGTVGENNGRGDSISVDFDDDYWAYHPRDLIRILE